MQYSLNYFGTRFCPLKVKITQFPGGSPLKHFTSLKIRLEWTFPFLSHCFLLISALCTTLLQLDSADEQAACIRRELDGRLKAIVDQRKVLSADLNFLFFFFSKRYNIHVQYML